MAGKGWTAHVAAAAGVAAGIGAAQLGLGYGLGVVVWPVTATADDSVWLGSLGWATWIASSATVFGAVIASRLRSGPSVSERPAGPWRFALAAAAAVGALLTVALIALPARAAVRSDTFSPQTVAAGYAVVGILFGLVIAYWAVVSRPVAANLIATAAWLWALAVAAIVVELIWHRSSATYLTSWQFADPGTGTRYGTIYWPSSLLTLLAALVIGIMAAWPAVRRGDLGVGAATSGAVGPLLVAAAFFVLAPQLTGSLGSLESAYLIAPYAVMAGLAGSALTVAIGRRSAQRRARRALTPQRTGRSGRSGRASGGRPAEATGVAAAPSGSAAAEPAQSAVTTAARGRSGSVARQSPPAAPATKPASAPGAAPPASATSKPGASKPGVNGPAAGKPGAKGDGAPPAATARNTPDARSTVAPPPAAPPVARINPSGSNRAGPPSEAPPPAGHPDAAPPGARKAPARKPRGNPRPDADAAGRGSRD